MKTQYKSLKRSPNYLESLPANGSHIHFMSLLMLLFFISDPHPSRAQDFILAMDGDLKKVKIIEDFQYTIIYQSGHTTVSIDKSLVRGYSIKNASIKYARDASIIDHQGIAKNGKLLYASTDSLYFWRGSVVYDPRLGDYISIGTNTIERLAIHRSGTHIQIDSMSPSALAAALPVIRKNSMLTTPPIPSANSGSDLISWSTEHSGIFKSPTTYKKANIGISIAGGFELMSAQRSSMKNSLEKSGQGGSVSNWFFGGTTTYPVKDNGAFFLDLGIDVLLNNTSRIALTYHSTSTFGARGIHGTAEVGNKKACELYYAFVPKPYTPLNTTKWVTSLRVGPSVNFLQAKVNGIGKDGNTTETKAGLAGQVSWEYYIIPHLSFSVQFTGRLVPSMNIPAYDPIRAHSVNFSSLDFGIGIKTYF
jgi:hypothetical protein